VAFCKNLSEECLIRLSCKVDLTMQRKHQIYVRPVFSAFNSFKPWIHIRAPHTNCGRQNYSDNKKVNTRPATNISHYKARRASPLRRRKI
jgi:hypothetical protein